jgi:hypothetical protein
VEDPFKQQTLKEPKLAQLDRGLQFTAVHSKGKPMPGPVMIEKAKYLYDEMEMTRGAHSLRSVMKNYL